MDLPSPTTPLNVNILARELENHPDTTFVSYLISGLLEGFYIGCFGPERTRISRNLRSAEDNPLQVQEYLEKELKAGRILGPFQSPPLPDFQCHPIGIVPKKTPKKFRAIMDLSYPEGESINDYICKEEFSLKYVTVDKAITFRQKWGTGCLLSKIDIAEAFRIIPVSPLQWHLLGIFWENEFYVDTRLTMGGRSSPGIFDNLPSALEWICTQNYFIENLCHLLDDYFTAEPACNPKNLDIILRVFDTLGVPVAPKKVEGPVTCIEFLGITLDSIKMETRISDDKLGKLREEVEAFQERRKCTKRELLSLIGSLGFACKVVVPGRSFLSRLINLSCSIKQLHHKVYLNKHVKEDMETWKLFLANWNGKNSSYKSLKLVRNP